MTRLAAPLALALLVLAPAAAAPVAHGSVRAAVGHWLEALPLPAEDGLARWTSGRSNVHALWVFEPLPGADADAGAGGLAEGAPLALRTARDLTGLPLAWASHVGCGVTTYRGLLAAPAGLVHYEVCDGGTEAYLAPTTDMRRADAARLATAPLPGAEAVADAFEARVGGATYAFVAAPSADGVLFRQARFVPLGAAPVTVEVRAAEPLLVRLHGVVIPADR